MNDSLLGPGLRAGLVALDDVGSRIAVRWSRPGAALAVESDVLAAGGSWRSVARFDESRPSVRWDAYGRIGVACVLLRRAGRDERQRGQQRIVDGEL